MAKPSDFDVAGLIGSKRGSVTAPTEHFADARRALVTRAECAVCTFPGAVAGFRTVRDRKNTARLCCRCYGNWERSMLTSEEFLAQARAERDEREARIRKWSQARTVSRRRSAFNLDTFTRRLAVVGICLLPAFLLDVCIPGGTSWRDGVVCMAALAGLVLACLIGPLVGKGGRRNA